MNKINLTSTYRTRCGMPVRVICIDRKHREYPVVALVNIDNQETIWTYSEYGQYSISRPENEYDLVEYDLAETFVLDQPIWVRDSILNKWVKRHFHSYEPENKIVYAWGNGKTSFTSDADDGFISWNFYTNVDPTK